MIMKFSFKLHPSLYFKKYSEISGWLKLPICMIHIDRYPLHEHMFNIPVGYDFVFFEWGMQDNMIYTSPLKTVLYFWMPMHQYSKMQRFTYFVKTGLFLQKSSWGEVSIREFFLNMKKKRGVERSMVWIRRSVNILFKGSVNILFTGKVASLYT